MKRILLTLAILFCLEQTSLAQPLLPPKRIGWTASAVTTANTNRDGSGTVYQVFHVREEGGQFVDSVKCFPLGTNAATQAVLIVSGPNGISDTTDNFIIGQENLAATTLGTHASTDVVTFHIGAWLPKGYRIFALVHATQAAGRQFICFADPSYQIY